MGVAHVNGRLSVGSGVNVIDYFNMPAVSQKIPPENAHDAAYLPRRTHVTGDIDIHEMAFDANNELWIINTKMSCLCTLDINHSIVPRWRPPFITGYDLTDRCHLNGLAMRDGKPRYVSALGTTDTPAGWREKKAFGGMIMDIESNRMIIDNLSMPHSPRWYRGQLWVLESGAGQLITVDEQTGEKKVIAEVPGFCRGIDFIERYAIIGLSEVRETAVFAGLPLTEREQDRKCGVWIVDIETGATVGQLSFSEGVQEIFSVQMIPWKFPALLDNNDPFLRTSYSLPDEAVKDFTPPSPEQVAIQKALGLHRRREIPKAIEEYKAIIDKDPKNVQILYHLGLALTETEQWEESIEALNKVISIQDNHAEAHNSLGHCYVSTHRPELALECYDAAIAADQKYPVAHFNRACAYLKMGDYEKGWEEYEWRWKMPNFRPLNCPQPKWTGEDISEKTLLVHTEQGNGDAFQFARFLPLAREKCNKLVVVCTEPMRLIFKEMDCVDEVRLPGNLPSNIFDVYCPIMSLAGVLGITLKNLPKQAPYLKINKQVVVPKLSKKNKKPKIGLAWTGNPNNSYNRQRSIPVETLMKLTEEKGLEFYSFQYPIQEQGKKIIAEHGVTDLEQELVGFAPTGALLQQMDMVVTVCTATAHLAGALGLPTTVLLSTQSDWRWGSTERVSKWYPNTSLIRQSKPGDWDGVLKKCQKQLHDKLLK